MKIKDIIQKNDKELTTLATDLRQKLSEFAIETRTQKVANVKAAHAHKKDLARVLTIQREREIEELEKANGITTVSEKGESNG